MIEFDRLIAVVNPVSSQARQAAPRLHNLREQFSDKPFELIHTSAEPDQTVKDIANKTEPGDLAAVVGGDGAFHYAMLATVGRDIPLLPLWGGNGNDISHMLNGLAPPARRTHELVREGTAVHVRPIELALSGLQTMYAAAYAGFGVMAEGAEIAKDPGYRSRPGYRFRAIRAMYEAAALAPEAFGATPFTITEPSGYRRSLTDLSFFNGDRVAKYGHPPVALTDPRAYMAECASNRQAAAWIASLALGRTAGDYITPGTPYHFKLEQAVRGHVDAETFAVPASTDVRVGIYADSYLAVSTRMTD